MLRITIRDRPIPGEGPVCLFLEGRIIGPWVSELEKVWRATRKEADSVAPIQINLNSVSYISQPGAALLCKMNAEGVELIASTPLTRTYIEEIRCSGARKPEASQMPPKHNGDSSKRDGMKRKHDGEGNHGKHHGTHDEAGPSHDEIAVRAYEIWIGRGGADGKHEQHWLEAEKELLSRPKKGTLR